VKKSGLNCEADVVALLVESELCTAVRCNPPLWFLRRMRKNQVEDVEPVGGTGQGEGDEQGEENAEGDQDPEANSLGQSSGLRVDGAQVLALVEAPRPEVRVQLPLGAHAQPRALRAQGGANPGFGEV
jgi:hypothetical protein